MSMICSRTESCSAIGAGRDEGFVEHLTTTGCPECFEMAQRILYRVVTEAVNRFLESLKPSDRTNRLGEVRSNSTIRERLKSLLPSRRETTNRSKFAPSANLGEPQLNHLKTFTSIDCLFLGSFLNSLN